jgi:hypothetical protein
MRPESVETGRPPNTVAGAAEPATPKAPDAAVEHAVADDTVLAKAALLAVIKDMAEDLPPMIAELEANARLSAQGQDHSEHAMYARLARVFRAGFAIILNAPQV